MADKQNDSNTGEITIFETRFHWKIFVLPTLILIISAILYWYLKDWQYLVWFPKYVGMGSGFLYLGKKLYDYFTNNFIVTNKIASHKNEFYARHYDEMEIGLIEGKTLDQSNLGRFLNYGDVIVKGNGEIVFRGISSPLEFREAINKAQKVQKGELDLKDIQPSLSGEKNESRWILIENETLKGARSITDAKIKAIALLNDGKQIITSEKYGYKKDCIAIYDADSLKLIKQYDLSENIRLGNGLSVISAPNQIIVDINDGLSVIDLQTLCRVGQSLPMFFNYSTHPETNGKAKTWWEELFIEIGKTTRKKERFRTKTIGVFDGGRTATVHCGIAAPWMPSNLVSWNLNTFQLKTDFPVFTPDVSPSPMMTDDIAGVPDKKNRQFITGQRFGWVNFWDIDTLKFVRSWRIESPESCDKARYYDHQSNSEIHSMAISDNNRVLAVGTFCGAIHICDIESGKPIFSPLVPKDFYYNQRIGDSIYSHTSTKAWEVTALHFFADDRYLIAGYKDSSLRIWDVKSGNEVGEPLPKGDKSVDLLCFIPQFRKAISAYPTEYQSSSDYGDNSDVRVWDLSMFY